MLLHHCDPPLNKPCVIISKEAAEKFRANEFNNGVWPGGPAAAGARHCWPVAVSRLGRGAWVEFPPNLLDPLHAPAGDSRRRSGLPPPVAAAAVAAEQSAASAVRRPLRSSICRAPPANVTLRCALGHSPSLPAVCTTVKALALTYPQMGERASGEVVGGARRKTVVVCG
jgi:hypothetical protein